MHVLLQSVQCGASAIVGIGEKSRIDNDGDDKVRFSPEVSREEQTGRRMENSILRRRWIIFLSSSRLMLRVWCLCISLNYEEFKVQQMLLNNPSLACLIEKLFSIFIIAIFYSRLVHLETHDYTSIPQEEPTCCELHSNKEFLQDCCCKNSFRNVSFHECSYTTPFKYCIRNSSANSSRCISSSSFKNSF